ncbi:MAG: thioesterase family protein [Eubacteriaceae bacterium]
MYLNDYIGKKNRIEKIVLDSETALAFGSGSIKVFSTPNMVGLMEKTALILVESLIPKEYSTVGTSLDVKHIAATPVGMKVYSEAELVEVDRKRLVFKIQAWDENEKIGEGMHERFIVKSVDFMNKTLSKKQNV